MSGSEEPHLYDQFEQLSHCAPSCRHERRELAILALCLSLCALGLGFIAGWGLHAYWY